MPEPARPRISLPSVIVLVVCAGVIFALMLPELLDTTRRGRQFRCQNNQRMLGIATINFETQMDRLPTYLVDYGIHDPINATLSPETGKIANPAVQPRYAKVGTWCVALLRYMEHQAVYERWSINKYPIAFRFSPNAPLTSGIAGEGFSTTACPNIPTLQCPAGPDRRSTPGANSYAANTGTDTPVDSDWFDESLTKKYTIFTNGYAGIGPNGDRVYASRSHSLGHISDGRSETMLFTENVQAIPWHRAGFIDAKDLILSEDATVIDYEPTSRYTQGIVMHRDPDDGSIAPAHTINSVIQGVALEDMQMTEANATALARPSSLHGDGVYMTMADGSVRFTRETIDAKVYLSLLAPNDSSEVTDESSPTSSQPLDPPQ